MHRILKIIVLITFCLCCADMSHADPLSDIQDSSRPELTSVEMRILKTQVFQCGNLPVTSYGVNQSFEVFIEVNPDRTIKETHVVDQSRMDRDSDYRILAESGLRALRNPKCSPFNLPPDKYEFWHALRFTFDPGMSFNKS